MTCTFSLAKDMNPISRVIFTLVLAIVCIVAIVIQKVREI